MYIRTDKQGNIVAIYANEAAMPKNIEQETIFVEAMPEKPELENPADSCRLILTEDKMLQWEIIPGTLLLSRAAIKAELERMHKDGLSAGLTAAAGENPVDEVNFNDPAFQTLWNALKQEKLASKAFLARARKK